MFYIIHSPIRLDSNWIIINDITPLREMKLPKAVLVLATFLRIPYVLLNSSYYVSRQGSILHSENAYTHTHIHTYLHTHTYTLTHTYTDIHTHTHSHTHIHMHTLTQSWNTVIIKSSTIWSWWCFHSFMFVWLYANHNFTNNRRRVHRQVAESNTAWIDRGTQT